MSNDHSHVNGTGRPTEAEQEAALVRLYGLCRRRSKLAKRDLCHDWHPAGPPATTPISTVTTRICCYCAPEGVTIMVRAAISESQVQTERERHGPRLFIERIVPPNGGIVMPGDPGFNSGRHI